MTKKYSGAMCQAVYGEDYIDDADDDDDVTNPTYETMSPDRLDRKTGCWSLLCNGLLLLYGHR